MSHSLEFAARRGERDRATRRLVTGLRQHGWRGGVASDDGMLYRDENTGVEAVLLEDAASVFDEPWESLGIHVEIPYLRPSFWADELFGPLAASAASSSAAIADPQDADPAPAPRSASTLAQSWLRGNAFAIEAMGADIPQLSRDVARYWWRYQRAKDEAQLRLAEPDVFVPALRPVRRGASRDVLLEVAWIDAIPIVLPPCDHVFVGRTKGSRVVASGIVAYDAVRSVLAGRLSPFTVADGVEAEILWPDDAAAAASAILALPLAPRRGVVDLPPYGFVDG